MIPFGSSELILLSLGIGQFSLNLWIIRSAIVMFKEMNAGKTAILLSLISTMSWKLFEVDWFPLAVLRGVLVFDESRLKFETVNSGV